jgi:PKD domain-containing protein
MTPKVSAARRHRVWPAVILGLFVAHAGCGLGLDGVEIPELDGPAELATAVTLTASPDIITADGFSTSLVTATVRGPNGEPIAGRDIFFSIADSRGRTADIGELRSPDTGVGIGTGIQLRTNAQGIAQVIYVAPPRTDATANQQIRVTARPVGTDASSAFARSVNIELRSAEPRLFPVNANNTAPVCGFAVELTMGGCPQPTPVPSAAPTPSPSPSASPTPIPTPAPSATPGGGCGVRPNTQVLFQSTAFDPDGTIVRYFWDFGNGRQADHPDVATSYNRAGTYTVTHLVTDNNGAQDACQATIVVQ